jgi:hypothetical protein
MTPNFTPNNSPEFDAELFRQKHNLTNKIASSSESLWGRWKDGIAITLFFYAFTVAIPGITQNRYEYVIILIGCVAPLLVLLYRTYKLEKRIELLVKVLEYQDKRATVGSNTKTASAQ